MLHLRPIFVTTLKESAKGRNIEFAYRGSLMPEHCTFVDHVDAHGINHPTCCKFHYRDEVRGMTFTLEHARASFYLGFVIYNSRNRLQNDVIQFFKDILTHKVITICL